MRSEQKELQVSFDVLKSKYAALKENINAMREECDVLEKEKDKFPHPESKMKITLEELQVFKRFTRYSPKKETL